MIHILGYVSEHWQQLSTSAWSKTIVRLMHSARAKQALGMNRNKRNRYRCLNWVQMLDPGLDREILVQEEDSNLGEMIYLLQGAILNILTKWTSFYQRYTEWSKIVNISIFQWNLQPIGQNIQISQPMTLDNI